MPTVKAQCPSCGGILSTDFGSGRAVCPFCKTDFDLKEAISRYNAKDRERGEAEEDWDRFADAAEQKLAAGKNQDAYYMFCEMTEKAPGLWRGWRGKLLALTENRNPRCVRSKLEEAAKTLEEASSACPEGWFGREEMQEFVAETLTLLAEREEAIDTEMGEVDEQIADVLQQIEDVKAADWRNGELKLAKKQIRKTETGKKFMWLGMVLAAVLCAGIAFWAVFSDEIRGTTLLVGLPLFTIVFLIVFLGIGALTARLFDRKIRLQKDRVDVLKDFIERSDAVEARKEQIEVLKKQRGRLSLEKQNINR